MAQKGVSAEKFSKQLKRFSKETVVKIALEAHGVLASKLYQNIVQRTPVLTGRARANWNISFNAPNIETSTDLAGVFVTGAPWTAQERETAKATLNNIGFGKLGTTVYIANGLPYIFGLEHGSSLKAPQGIVQGAIQGTLEELSSKGIKLKGKL